MDLSLNLNNTNVIITGGSGFIGSAVVTAFLSAGARVTSLDLRPPQPQALAHDHFHHIRCDIASEENLAEAFNCASINFGPIACCVALAGLDYSFIPHHESLADMDVEQWRKTHRTNVEGTFLTARAWLRHIRDLRKSGESRLMEETKNVGLIIVGSESGHFGVKGNADYAAGKSAVQVGLLKSLTDDVSRIWPGAR